ncbi:response regulator [uncultured Oxalicibacterium sp.]|uniref:response regulator n=1 Tax=uncultured Oxalicibacterium sp. TaxID=1168540 RepID=UPI0025DDE898|nr:response regulator [uncultured Oxalicibacterium sp.]
MPTVLIAEDNPDARESLTEALRIAGYTVLAAQDGQVAIEIAKVFKPDVVLTDIDMPGLDGLSLCFQIKANPDLENIPVVLLSGRLPIYQPEAVFDVIQKPLLIEEVLSSVRAATTVRHRAA